MVHVLAKTKQPLMPCSEKRARLFLARGRARIHRMFPFTIRLIDRLDSTIQPIALKLDPGAKTTGIALVRETKSTSIVLDIIELEHRGSAIREALVKRSAFRRRRRSANLRYRSPRFNNRTRPEGWLPPSLQHRVDTTRTWVSRLRALTPIATIVQELVRFDTQLMQNINISGVEYQQGTLAGYELREYLLERDRRTCVYCDAQNVPLNLDHVVPQSRGGSSRPSNLVLACIRCNQRKGSRDIRDFLARDRTRLERIAKHLMAPLADATAVNATRWALFRALRSTDLDVSTGSGGRTKWNRKRFAIPKTRAFDAICAGNMDHILAVERWQQPTLLVKAAGRGAYRRTRLTHFGFPRGYLMRSKRVRGFATGDMIIARVPNGKKIGTYCGRVAVRATGSFNIQSGSHTIQGISHTHCRIVQRNDGYRYARSAAPPQPERRGLRGAVTQ